MEETMAPDKWMTVRFNIWNFGNPGNQPVNDPALNRSYFLDVDWVKVTKVAPVTVAASVTEVGGVAVSSGATTTVPNLSIVKGQVTGTASMINVVIRRLSDNTKWKGYADGNGPAGWVPASQNVGTGTNNAQPTWTTNGVMPSGSNVTAGDYQISADVLSGGTYVSSPVVTVRIAASTNNTPVAQGFSPIASNNALGRSYQTNSVYFDQDGYTDITECLVEIRQGNVSTQAIYNRPANKLYLLQDNGQRTVGFDPGSANVISNGLVALNCAETNIFVSEANKQVQVRWNFISKSPLLGTNDINLDVFDASGAHPGFIKRATWSVYGAADSNATPIPVAFAPYDGSSSVGAAYATNAVYFDDNGYEDLDNLVVGFRQGFPGQAGFQETRAYYNRPTNKLYLLNDAGTAWLGGVTAGTPAPAGMLSNSLITLDCTNTSTFVSAAKKQVQVRWRFITKTGMAGVNDVHMEAFDVAGARSGFIKRARWTVIGSASKTAASSNSSQLETKNSGASTGKTTDTQENPFVGEKPSIGSPKDYPITTTGDGTQGPPIDDGEPVGSSSSDSSASAMQAPPDPSASAS